MSFSGDLKRFESLPSKNKLTVVVVLFAVFIFAVVASSLYLGRASQPFKLPLSSQLAPSIAPKKASLSLVPRQGTITKGETFIVGINFNTGDYRVDTADCVLQYDPNVLKVNKVFPGIFFAQYPRKGFEKDKVYLTGTSGAAGEQVGGVKGKGSFGSIEFKVVGTGETTLKFVKEETIIVSKGENVLGEISDGTYTIAKEITIPK